MTSTLPFIQPFPTEPPRSSLPIPKRTKRSTACTACKTRKSRCGGSQPCDKCIELGTECVFATTLDRRRKFAQRRAELELISVQQQLDAIVDAYDRNDAAKVDEILASIREQRPARAGTDRQVIQSLEDEMQGDNPGYKDAFASVVSVPPSRSKSKSRFRSSSTSSSSSSVGSLNEINTLAEDPNRDSTSRAAGYIGKESEIAWMQKLEAEATKLDNKHCANDPIEESITAMSYHIDHIQIAEPYFTGDPTLLPPRSWAAHLVNIYFEAIAPSFPLLHKPLFLSQFNQAYQGPAEPPARWLAVLNLIFATASKWYQLADPVAGKDVDDRIFLSRAIALSTSRNLEINHPDLNQVQVDLLLAIYYLTSGQVNRAYQINGRAVRSAIALGLNLRASSDDIDPVSKETRTQIWWSIFSIEHLLTSMTGRASSVDYRSMSLYPPIPYDEGQFDSSKLHNLLASIQVREERLQWTVHANDLNLNERTQWFRSLPATQSLYFFLLVDLFLITHAAVLAVYGLTAKNGTGQSEIPRHQEKLYTWLSNLKPPFAFTNEDGKLDVDRTSKSQVSLALEFYSSQIILARPCLTRPDVKAGTNIRFPRSRFGNDTAKTCIHSAVALIAVLPETPDTDWILHKTPWWCILHFIMQALTVLLMQLSIGPIRTKSGPANVQYQNQSAARQHQGQGQGPSQGPAPEHDFDAILEACKKALRWISRMAQDDQSSCRAFEIANSLIRRIAKAKGFDLHRVPSPALDLNSSRTGSSSSSSSGSRSRRRRADSPLASQRNAPGARAWRDQFNWGPDCTVCEADWEQQQTHSPFVLDPTLFSADM
ncbi:Zn(II)2Cys6 transcription factor [Aspergillus stella-maris]|uniref:Zn(II)2Cys6 transcription factor n=1 Tax=Aspergillus stella-maris TaxID=1810926 RepID=UPI003CCCAE1C